MHSISKATESNWNRLNTSIEGRLAKRANKTLSAKKVIANTYAQTRNATTLLQIVSKIDRPLEDIIYTLSIKQLDNAGILQKAHVQKVLSEYKHLQLVEISIPTDIWNTDDDLLGFVYQSLISEGDRNATGQYYTNQSIVHNMLHGLTIGEDETLYDPCCGSGAFLLGVNTEYPQNLYGTDINDLAVMIAKINLLTKYCDKEFEPNMKCVDFLLENNKTQKYDYIYTNPPWGADKSHKYFIEGIKSKERASMFLVKALQMLKPEGHLHFLLPTSLLKIQSHKDIRQYVLSTATIDNIELYKDRFDGVFTDYFSIKLLPKYSNIQDYIVRQSDVAYHINYPITPNQSDILIAPKNELDESIHKKVKSKAHDYLTHSRWALGIVTGNNKEKLLDVREGKAEAIYTGKEIEPFVVTSEKKYVVFDPTNFQQCAKEEFFRAPEKLVYRFIANRPIVAYDDQQRLCLNSANILIPDIDTISVKSMVAFLNSSLYQYLYLQRFSDLKVLKSNLSELPFPAISESLDHKLAYLVEQIIKQGRTRELIREIDSEIYNLFDINSDEQKFVEHIVL